MDFYRYSPAQPSEVTEDSQFPAQPVMPRMGRISTICCGYDFGTVAEVQAHRTNH